MTIESIITKLLNDFFEPLVPVLIGIAVILFLWGVVKYIWAYGDKGKIEESRQFMTYGIISIFALISIWGLVGILQDVFFSGSPPTSPPEILKY